MRLLTLVEQLLMLLEKQKQPMHVGGLFLFELPEEASPNFVANLVQQMQTSQVKPTSPFDQVLHNHTLWKTVDTFDVYQHLRHVVLGTSDAGDDVLSYVSKVHATALDKSRPLWECHIIEGVPPASANEPARFALYFKIHHALVDGVAAMRLVERSLSTSPTEVMQLPLWALLRRNQDHLQTVIPKKRSPITIAKEQVSSIGTVFSELKDSFSLRNTVTHVKSTQAPRSILNQRISQQRQMMTQSYQHSRFNQIAKHLNVSSNDVVLVVCATALRRYLLSLYQLPIEPLIGFVPISLRTDNSATGNQASLVLCNLATHVTDPIERLQIIHESMTKNKARFGRMNQAEVINYSAVAYAWEGVNLLTNAYPKKQAFNLLISNVPGPKQTLYWNGAKLSSLYPASVIFDGQALNITLVSYLDHMDFGIVACTKHLPNIDKLPSLIEEALIEYEQLCQS